jgi:hypothetical protein
LNVINAYQADIRRNFLESQRIQDSAAQPRTVSLSDSPRYAAARAESTPTGPYQPIPIDGHLSDFSATHVAPQPTRSQHHSRRTLYEDSGFHSGVSAVTSSDEASEALTSLTDENTTWNSGHQWPNDAWISHSLHNMSTLHGAGEDSGALSAGLDIEGQMAGESNNHSEYIDWGGANDPAMVNPDTTDRDDQLESRRHQ